LGLGVGQEHKKRAKSPKRCKIGPGYYYGLIGSHTYALSLIGNISDLG